MPSARALKDALMKADIPPSVKKKIRRAYRELKSSEEVDAKPCGAETYSHWHFNANQVDGYWIRCDEVGPHTVHLDNHTGLTWEGE